MATDPAAEAVLVRLKQSWRLADKDAAMVIERLLEEKTVLTKRLDEAEREIHHYRFQEALGNVRRST